jgi:hypothetical protein
MDYPGADWKGLTPVPDSDPDLCTLKEIQCGVSEVSDNCFCKSYENREAVQVEHTFVNGEAELTVSLRRLHHTAIRH